MRVEIISIVDESTSMGPLTTETIKGYNDFIDEQKKVPGEAKASLITFNTIPKIVYEGKPLADVEPMSLQTYRPGGFTALLDAIGLAISSAGARYAALPEGQKPEKVIVQIITDGEENRSREFNLEKIKEMVKHQTEVYKWEFVFLGANIDAFGAAANLGFNMNNVAAYAATTTGTADAYRGFIAKTTSLRMGASADDLVLSSIVSGSK